MDPTRVTFDSNVWEAVVFPDRHPKDKNYSCLLKIKRALQDGQLQGFICETVGTLEAIHNEKRASYFAHVRPIVKVQTQKMGNSNIGLTITIEPDHSQHPGLKQQLTEPLQEAIAIGMRLLTAPRYLPIPELFLNQPAIYAPEVFNSAGAYRERFGETLMAIETRGVGGAVIAAITKRIEQRLGSNAPTSKAGAQLLEYAKDKAEESEIKKAIAEWADGDSMAAHVAIENDLFCSEDQGKSTGGPSVLNENNRAWLMATYGVKVVTIAELAGLAR